MAGVAALLVVLGTVIGFGIAPGGYAPPAMAAAWRIAGSLQQPGWFGGSTGVSEPGSATITCPGRTDCFATEPVSGPQGGSTVEATVDGGASWHMVPLPGGLDLVSGLSCPAVRTCIGLARRATPRAPVAVVTTDGGRSWSTHAIHETLARTYDVTCPTTKDCLVVGNGIATARTPTEGSSPTVLVSTDGGRSWHTSSRPKELLPAFPDAVSCVSRTTCVVTGGTTVPTAGGSMGDADIQYTVDRGRHWVHAQLPSQLGQVLAVSCTRSGLCLATAEPRPISTGTTTAFSRNIALVSHDRGHTWSRAPDQGFDVARAMTLTCTSATVCWVGGLNPSAPLDSLSATLLGTHDGGQTWSPAALPRGTGKLTLISSISCSSPAHCTGLAWSDKTTAQVVLRNSP